MKQITLSYCFPFECKDTMKFARANKNYEFFVQNREQTFAHQAFMYCKCFIGCPPQVVSSTYWNPRRV